LQNQHVDGEFNFSYYDEAGKEWWFTFRLDDVDDLIKREHKE